MPATKKCPTCGTENSGETKFCFGCGERFEAPAPFINMSLGNGPVICSKCRTTNAPNATFCARCGSTLSETAVMAAPAPMEEAEPGAGLCDKCGSQNDPSFAFCARCGNKLGVTPPKPKVIPGKCYKCGNQNDPSFAFCARCGNKLGAETNKPQKAAVKAAKPTKTQNEPETVGNPIFGGVTLVGLIKNSAILLIAIIMAVAAFLPIFTYSSSIELDKDTVDVKVSFTAIDAVTFFLDSMQDEPSDELLEKIDELSEKFEEALDDAIDEDTYEIDAKKYRKAYDSYAEELVKLSIRKALSTKEHEMTVRDITGGVFALTYLVAVVLFAIFAIINFVLAIFSKSSFYRPAVSLMCLVGALIPATALAVEAMVCSGGILAMFTRSDGGYGIGAILALALAIIGAVLLLLERVFIRRTGVYVKPIITRTLSAVLVAVMLIFATAPIASISVKNAQIKKKATSTDTTKASVSVEVDAVDLDEIYGIKLSAAEKKALRAALKTTKTVKSFLSDKIDVEAIQEYKFNRFTKTDIADGKANAALNNELFALGAAGAGMDLYPFFTYAYLASLLTTLAAGLLLWQILVSVSTGRARKLATVPTKIANILFSGASVGISIMFIVCVNAAISLAKLKELSATIGLGSIIVLVCAIVAIFLPLNSKVKEVVYDEEDYAA